MGAAARLPLLLGIAACQSPAATDCDNASLINAAAAQSAIAPNDPSPMASLGRRGVQVQMVPILHVDEVQVGRRANGSVEVAARLANCTAAPVQALAVTRFFSSSGGEAEAVTAPKRVFLPPGGSRTYGEISASPRPTSFLIEISGGD
jgi:hypothetical protein